MGEVVAKQPTRAKPIATNAINEFWKANRDTIKKDAQQRVPADLVGVSGTNLQFWRDAKLAAWEALDDKEKAKYETAATKHNNALKEGPTAEHIYK
jgi:hypothetical protein